MEEAARCYDVLAHDEDTAYAVAEYRKAVEKVAAAIPAGRLDKIPEQSAKAPERQPRGRRPPAHVRDGRADAGREPAAAAPPRRPGSRAAYRAECP